MQKRDRRRALTRCRNCSRSKVKCSRGFPCERCFSLCLVCSAPNGDTRPFMDVVLSSVDHAHVVQTFMEVFTHLHARANVDRAAMLPELRTWRNVSLRMGTDVTLGIFEHVCRALNVSAHELEAVDEKEVPREWYTHSHTSTFTSLSRACMGEGVPESGDEDESENEGPESPESARARLHDDECLKALKEEDGAPTFVSVSTHTDVFLSVEECGSPTFCTTEQANKYVSSYRMHPLVLIASMIAPSDRQLWFKAYLAMFSTTTCPNTRHTTMVKFCGIDGSIDLYILRVRKAMLTTNSHHRRASHRQPRTVAITASFEKVPASRHVTRRPGFRHHIIEGFRQGSHSTPNQTHVAHVADTTDAVPASTGGVDREKIGMLKDLPIFRLPLLESLPLPAIAAGDMQRVLERDTSIFAPAPKRLKHLFADTRSTSIGHSPCTSTATSDMPPAAISPLASSSARVEAIHTDADIHATKQPHQGLITATTSTLVRAITPATPTNSCCEPSASKSTSTQTLSLTIDTSSPRAADAPSPFLRSDTQAPTPTHVAEELPHHMQTTTPVGGMSRRAVVDKKSHAQTHAHGTQSVEKAKGEAAKVKQEGERGERGEGKAVGEVVGDVVAKYMHRTQQVLANAGLVRADSDPTFYPGKGWHALGPALSDYTGLSVGAGVGAHGLQRGAAGIRASGSSVSTLNRSTTTPSILQHAHMSKRECLDGNSSNSTTITTTSPTNTTATPNTTHHPFTFSKGTTPLVHTTSPRLRGGPTGSGRIIQDTRSPHANRLNGNMARSNIEDAYVSRVPTEKATAESPAFKHQHGWRGFDALLQAMLLSDSSEARLCSEPHGPTRDNNTRGTPPITVTQASPVS